MDNFDGCVASLTDFGTVPGIGGYDIMWPASGVSEWYTIFGRDPSDAGRGSGTSLTVVRSSGVGMVMGADTDFPVACMVADNG